MKPHCFRLTGTPAGRKLLFALLYLSEGAPIGFLWWALPTRLRGAGVPVEDITALTALLVIPWTFKFAWAPFVDVLRSLRWTRRSWIVAAQLMMGLALLPLLVLDLQTDLALIVPFLVLHAVAAATQDVAIDAYAIATVPTSERGALNGWMQSGMLLGRSVFGGVSLLLFERLGSPAVHLLLITTIWLSMAVLLFSRDGTEPAPYGKMRERWQEFAARVKSALQIRASWFGLLFALIAGAGFEA
ncbi:MAG TPA: MFS transporter, partial [Bacteroidota bacterium]|nr:MFS transporter [Bacteroidota bacterium]